MLTGLERCDDKGVDVDMALEFTWSRIWLRVGDRWLWLLARVKFSLYVYFLLFLQKKKQVLDDL